MVKMLDAAKVCLYRTVYNVYLLNLYRNTSRVYEFNACTSARVPDWLTDRWRCRAPCQLGTIIFI